MQQPPVIYEACGCEKCGKTGYAGRIGVYEILRVTPKVKTAIHENASTDGIRKIAVGEGMRTLQMSARKLVLDGVTSVNEMLRISFENE